MSQSQIEPPEQGVSFLKIHDVPVYFREDWDVGIGGGLWSTGMAMAKYFQRSAMEVRRSLMRLSSKKLSVLELGSGNGFLSICFMALAHDLIANLVITDTAEHLGLMEQTLKNNEHILNKTATRPNVIVAEHNWGEFVEESNDSSTAEKTSLELGRIDGSTQFDFIFGSDLAYREVLYDPLIASLKKLCHSETIFLLGVTMQDTKPKFFHRLIEAGFRYERLGDHLMEPQYRGTTFGLFIIQKREY